MHNVQEGELARDQDPGRQIEHTDAAASENWPAGHYIQELEDKVEYWPAGQGKHALIEVAPLADEYVLENYSMKDKVKLIKLLFLYFLIIIIILQ